ncbi:Uncharacterised protein g5556 [Pycnogonum litorale]
MNFTEVLVNESEYSSARTFECDELFNCSATVVSGSELQASNNSNLRPFVLPLSLKIPWTIIFGILVISAILGNTLVIWIVIAHRRMRTVTNYFLLNLSIGDLMMATFNVIFNYIYMIEGHWPFGPIYCVINNFIASITVCTSVFSIMAISIDRYVATVRMRGMKMTKVVGRSVIAIIWVGSAILASPTAMFSSTILIEYKNDHREICLLQWPDGPEGKSQMDYIYNIAFWQLTYVLPVLSMAITYGIIAKELWGVRWQSERQERNMELIKSKRKVIRMFMVILFTFASCWLPYHICFIYKYQNTSMLESSYIQHLYLSFYWLAMSNSALNPIIYYWMNAK